MSTAKDGKMGRQKKGKSKVIHSQLATTSKLAFPEEP